MAVSYAIWRLLALGEPQPHVHAARRKVMSVDVFAGNAQQARENAFADIVRAITSAPCFAGFVQSVTRDRLVIATPFDLRDPDRVRAGTIEVVARETTVLAGRGQTSIVQVFDEMAWVDPASSKAPADALYEAASPALDQARGWSLVFTISSPSQRAGKFFELHRQATQIDLTTDRAAYPEMLTVQFASWSPYLDADAATQIPLGPQSAVDEASWFTNEDGQIKCFPANPGAPVIDDDELRQRARADPRAFRVENGGQWADVANAFLEPHWVDRIFRQPDTPILERQTRRHPGRDYAIHIDPSTRHDATAYTIAHTERTDSGNIVVIDVVHRFKPEAGDLDWDAIYDQLEHDIVAFQPYSITVDQHGGIFVVNELSRRVRLLQLPQRINIFDIAHTRAGNIGMGDVFRQAVKRGHVRSYYDRQLDLELRFLQDVNGSPKAPTTGPIRTDDVAVSVMVVVNQLLGWNADAHQALQATTLRGLTSLNPRDQATFDMFSSARPTTHNTYRNPARPRTVSTTYRTR
ncbi:MAG: hypothetical protein AB7U39_25465 [Ilumatobacteraceae bacterium]